MLRSKLVDLYLQKSGQCTLTVHVKTDNDKLGMNPEAFEILFPLLSQSHRWERLTLSLGFSIFKHIIPHLSGNDALSKLHTLNLTIYYLPKILSLEDITIFECCPSLRHVSICYFDQRPLFDGHTFRYPAGALFKVKLPQAQLTHYKEEARYGSTQRISVVERKRDTLALPDGSARADQTSCFIALHSLRLLKTAATQHPQMTKLHLVISTRHFVLNSSSAENLYLPNLQHLIIHRSGTRLPKFSLTFILCLVKRSQSRLKSLEVSGYAKEAGVISRILALTDELEELRLKLVPSTDLNRLRFDFWSPHNLIAPSLRLIQMSFPVVDQHATALPDWALNTILQLNALVESRNIVEQKEQKPRVSPVEVIIEDSSPLIYKELISCLKQDAAHKSAEIRAAVEPRVIFWENVLRSEPYLGTEKVGDIFRPSYNRKGKIISDVVREMEAYPIEDYGSALLQVSPLTLITLRLQH